MTVVEEGPHSNPNPNEDFYNNITGDQQWEEPEGYKDLPFSQLKLLMKPELRAALALQGAWRAKKARKDVREERGKQAGAESDELWTPVLDPASGEYVSDYEAAFNIFNEHISIISTMRRVISNGKNRKSS